MQQILWNAWYNRNLLVNKKEASFEQETKVYRNYHNGALENWISSSKTTIS